MEGALQAADVYAKLKRRRGADRDETSLLLHYLLRTLAIGGGEIAVVDEEAVGLVGGLTILAECGGDGLALLARVGEHEALVASGVVEDVAQRRIGKSQGILFGSLGGKFLRLLGLTAASRVVMVGLDGEEMLHGQPPFCPSRLHAGNDRAAMGSGGEIAGHHIWLANGGRQTDTARIDTCCAAETLDEAQRLAAPVAPEEGMDLVDDDEAKVAEEVGNLCMAMEEHGLKALGRDLQDAAGMLQEFLLPRLRHVAMPVPHRDTTLLADVVEPHELVVDECLEGGDIQTAHRRGRILLHQRDDGKEGCLRLARNRRRREQEVGVGIEQRVSRRGLYASQRCPSILIDILLDERRISGEYVHSR